MTIQQGEVLRDGEGIHFPLPFVASLVLTAVWHEKVFTKTLKQHFTGLRKVQHKDHHGAKLILLDVIVMVR
jgi:hypothetical protein